MRDSDKHCRKVYSYPKGVNNNYYLFKQYISEATFWCIHLCGTKKIVQKKTHIHASSKVNRMWNEMMEYKVEVLSHLLLTNTYSSFINETYFSLFSSLQQNSLRISLIKLHPKTKNKATVNARMVKGIKARTIFFFLTWKMHINAILGYILNLLVQLNRQKWVAASGGGVGEDKKRN